MKIAIDALGIHYFGGGRTATLGLLEALFSLDTQNQYLVVLTQFEPGLLMPSNNVQQWIAPFKSRLLVRFWAQMTFPSRLREYDLVHFMKNLGVFGLRSRKVVTVYDLTTLVIPEIFPLLDVWYWRYLQKFTLRSADRVIAISQNTARDICHYYQISPEKIRVIYPAHSIHFSQSTPEGIEQVRRKYQLPEEYILHVGRIDRKKNLPLLLEAFAIFQKLHDFKGKLVLVGEEYRKSRDTTLHTLIDSLSLRDQVVFTGVIPDFDLPAIFSAALITVFCSRHEGFGIVALEAMACGAPLIISPAGAVVEAVGDAAYILKAEDPKLLADVMGKVIVDPALRMSMRQKGLERAALFSWRSSATQTLQLYEEVVQC